MGGRSEGSVENLNLMGEGEDGTGMAGEWGLEGKRSYNKFIFVNVHVRDREW